MNQCNGRGSCEPSAVDSRIYQCTCDSGFTGTDCSSRLCPRGDDPMTKETYIGNSGELQGNEVQVVTVKGDSSHVLAGSFTLTYTDKYGGSWTTRPMPVSSADATAIARHELMMEDLLESLPNQVIPDVAVVLSATTYSNTYTITFLHSANSGDQNMLTCDITGCDLDGCQPRFSGLKRNLAITREANKRNLIFNNEKKSVTTEADLSTTGISYTIEEVSGEVKKLVKFVVSADGITAGQLTLFGRVLQTGQAFSVYEGDTEIFSLTLYSFVIGTTTYEVHGLNTGDALTATTVAQTLSNAATKVKTTVPANSIDLTYSVAAQTTLASSYFSSSLLSDSSSKVTFGKTRYNDKTFKVSSRASMFRIIVAGDSVVDEVLDNSLVPDIVQELKASDASSCIVSENTKGTKESDICSSRGTCDTETGLCECYTGYTGENCDSQNAQI